jgi:hypothetical protein
MPPNSLDWLSLLLGGAIGLAFNYVPNTFSFLWRFRAKHQIQGTWNYYYFNFQENRPSFNRERWKVSRGFANQFSVEAIDPADESTRYKGKLQYESGFYLFSLKSAVYGHDEAVFARFNPPTIGTPLKCIGVALAKDFDGYASVHAVLLSRDELTEDEVRETMKRGTQTANEGRVLRAK